MSGDKKTPCASVIIPAFNAEQFIAECLHSVVKQQTDFEFEVIVIDDGSTDGTAAIILEKFPQVRLSKKPNGGPGSARNQGAEEAVSDILVFIDSDDRMLEGRLQHQVGYMLAHPEVKLSFGNQRYQAFPDRNSNMENGLVGSDDFSVVKSAYQRLIVKGNYIANTATAVRRDAYLEVGGQPEEIFVGEDYAMCCAIARKYPITVSNRYLTWYRQDDHGNLMGSKHTYIGPPTVLLEELQAYGHMLSPDELEQASERLQRLVNMLMGYLWITHDRRAALIESEKYKDFLPSTFSFRWKLMTLVPSAFPAWLRRLKHRGKVSHR